MISLNEIIASISAGCASTFIGHPLDTIKVYQQTSKNKSNFLHTTRRIFVNGGNNPMVFFNGIAPPLFNQILMNTVMFSVFLQVKSFSFWNDGFDGGTNSYAMALSAGLLSGFATACLSTPTDWIKIQAQLQGSNANNNKVMGSIGIVSNLFRENNFGNALRVLYRGHVANLGREGIFTMVYLGFYDRIMDTMSNQTQNERRLGHVVAVSAFTGALAWVSSYPFDTIKSIAQAKSSSSKGVINYSAAMKDLWRIGGLSAFYRGCGASTIRAMLVTSIRMLAYEWTLNFF